MKTHSTNPNLSEPRWLRVLLTATALGFLLLMLVVPLVAVFYEALKGGWGFVPAISDRSRGMVCHQINADYRADCRPRQCRIGRGDGVAADPF